MTRLQPSRPASAARTGSDIANTVPSVARALLGLVEERGLSPERLCRGLGFTYADLRRPGLQLSYRQIRDLVLRAQRVLHDPALGLATGARQTPVSWGIAGLAMLTFETLGEAIAYAAAHQSDAGALLDHAVEQRDREVHVEISPKRSDLRIEPFLVQEAFSCIVAIGRSLVGPALDPLRVHLALPRPANEVVYRQFFRCPVHFGAGAHVLSFDAQWLGARLPGFDRITSGLVQAQLNTLLDRPIGRQDVVESIANRIRFDADRRPDQRELAQQINVSDRTLRRRLQAQRTTFRTLRDDARYEKARDLLAHSSMTIAEIAEALGYSDARAFRRAFKRWSGSLPTTFRDGADAA